MVKGWLCDICCLGIPKSSTVQRYQIYRLTKNTRHMFTIESSKGNLLTQMRLILICRSHKFLYNIAIPHSCGGFLGLVDKKWMENGGKNMEGKWRASLHFKKVKFSHIGGRKRISCVYIGIHFFMWIVRQEQDKPRAVVVVARSALLRIWIWQMIDREIIFLDKIHLKLEK